MASDSETEESKKEEQEKSWIVKFFTNPEKLFRVSAGFIVFALLAPWIFTRPSPDLLGINFGKPGDIGCTFGIMSPFIAIAAAIITFAAFWMQYEANQELRKQAEKDREDNQNERDNAEIRIRKQQIISRFYEMLQIHRENVKELEWIQNIHLGEGKDECVTKRGHRIFLYLQFEFNFIYFVVDNLYPNLDVDVKVKKAYNIFYRYASDEKIDYEMRKKIKGFIRKNYDLDGLFDFLKKDCNLDLKRDGEVRRSLNMLVLYQDEYFRYQPPFSIHFEELNNYYRHLFLTVKTIVNEEEKYLTYNEKRDLLRILRAQLTSTEQIMLCYNWFSGNGIVWEEDDPNGNHFFTQYRMVHNIIPKRFLQICLLDGHDKAVESLINYLKKQPIYTYIKKYCSKNDPMFEFEQWEGHPKFDCDK